VPGVGVLLPLEDSLRQTIYTSVKLHKAGGAISALLEKYIDTASDRVVNIEQTLVPFGQAISRLPKFGAGGPE
jgi:hypothetical protein